MMKKCYKKWKNNFEKYKKTYIEKKDKKASGEKI